MEKILIYPRKINTQLVNHEKLLVMMLTKLPLLNIFIATWEITLIDHPLSQFAHRIPTLGHPQTLLVDQ